MDRKQIEDLAKLAKLEFSPEELDRFTKDMGNIIGFVNKLGELDTAGIPPASHVSGAVNVLREDAPAPSMARQDALSGAPEHDESGFIIPRVI
ncbi:MAG: Asp-tRNA(Asn)/Glu-tRNA(Gln) amidotransferase subunit GatC [Bacillota bacterium]